MTAARSRALLCPSAPPGIEGAKVFAVSIGGEDGAVAYLDRAAPLTEELRASVAPLAPTEVFRIAAPCQESRCVHFEGSRCQLVTRIVGGLAATDDDLPRCAVRADCRWFAQEAKAACARCPQIITAYHNAPEEVERVAMPPAVSASSRR